MRIDPFIDDRFGRHFAADPIVVYDGGAAGVLYDPFQDLTSGRVSIVGFEPVQESFDALKRRYGDNENVQLFQVALDNQAGQATFYLVSKAPTVSSLMRRDLITDAEPFSVECKTVECKTIDDIVQHDGLSPPDFLKLDTEGSELRILTGGQQTLTKQVLGVYCEVGFWMRPEAGALFWQIDAFLGENGFILFDLQLSRSSDHAIGGKKTRVNSGNALYLRDFYAYYDAHLHAAGEACARAKLLKMIAICTAFIYLPYAIELVDFGRERGLLSGDEVARLQKHLCCWSDIARRVPAFPGKQALANIFDFLTYCLQPKAKKSVPAMYNNIGTRPRAMVRHKLPRRVTLKNPIRMRQHPNVTTVQIENE